MTAYTNGAKPTTSWRRPTFYTSSLWLPLRTKIPRIHRMFVEGCWIGFAYSRQRQGVLALKRVNR